MLRVPLRIEVFCDLRHSADRRVVFTISDTNRTKGPYRSTVDTGYHYVQDALIWCIVPCVTKREPLDGWRRIDLAQNLLKPKSTYFGCALQRHQTTP